MSENLAVFTSSGGEAAVLAAYDNVLSQWGVPFEELDVATSFGQTHVIASGPTDGPPVVRLHAYFATAASWYRTVGALSDTYRTFAVDVLGEPNKSRPVQPIRSMDDYRQWFTELADGLGLTQMYLVGNSMGGFGATYLAIHLGRRVRKLVLISPAATIHRIIPFYTHLFLPKAMYLFLPWLPGLHHAMGRVVHWLYAGLPTDGPWADLFYLTMVHGSTQVRVFPRVFTAAELAQISAPALLLVGDHERVYNPEAAIRAALSLMPSVEVEIIPGAHHVAAIAQPEAVNASLLRFLRRPEVED
jgi:pimeloyl-ACP methyl ester carboxylesterase